MPSITETILCAPLALASLGLVVVGGRVAETTIDVQSAAFAAARAASIERTSTAAHQSATRAARVALESGLPCEGGPRTAVNTAGLQAAGAVSVTVTCTVSYADLGMPGFPATKTVTRSAESPVDTFRGVP